MSYNNTNNYNGPSPAFVRSTIKIAHPDWTPEQVESELQKKMQELSSASSDDGCEFCSS